MVSTDYEWLHGVDSGHTPGRVRAARLRSIFEGEPSISPECAATGEMRRNRPFTRLRKAVFPTLISAGRWQFGTPLPP